MRYQFFLVADAEKDISVVLMQCKEVEGKLCLDFPIPLASIHKRASGKL